MRRAQLVVLAFLVTASLAVAWIGWHLGRRVAGEPEVEVALKTFRLPSLHGLHVGPQDFREQVLLVEFWATWCGPCHVQARILEPLYEELGGSGVQFLAVSLGEDEETVREFVAERPFAYPVLFDEPGEIMTAAGIYGLPTVVIYDPRGEIVFQRSGIVGAKALRAALADAGATAAGPAQEASG